MSALRDALDRRDPEAIIETLEDEPHLRAEDADVIDAWEWIEDTPHASAFARSLLRALGTSMETVRVPSGWVARTGLGMAERALETVDDADGPTRIYGTLVCLDVTNEEALDHWVEMAIEGDGYFDPDSLYRAYTQRFQPGASPERMALVRAVEVLVSFSWNLQHYPRTKTLEYLARDLRSQHPPISVEAVAQAMERLQAVESLTLPSSEEIEASLQS